MKKLSVLIGTLGLFAFTSCVDLDLNPLSAASSENWYSTPDEVNMSLNDFYRAAFFKNEHGWALERNTDNYSQRNWIGYVANGTINSQQASNPDVQTAWSYTYKNISRANRILESLDRLEGKYAAAEIDLLRAEACFFRAFAYARLVTFFGDCPFYLKAITPEEAFEMGRTDKAVVLEQIYRDYDFAAEHLPLVNNNGGLTRVNKGCALAFKARVALNQYDYPTVVASTKALMELGQYKLYPDYGALFRDKGLSNGEVIFSIVHSNDLELDDSGTPTTQSINSFMPRSIGGTANAQPSWELLAAYEMTNGKTIDEPDSGFDPHNPFENRDPRCCETFAAPGSVIFDCVWDPSPAVAQVMDYQSGQMVKNKDSKPQDQYAAYNGCTLRKGAQTEWRTPPMNNDNPVILMRYADVLLMYAEAKIELNQIDDSVLNCINDIRARAYGVNRAQTTDYPAITTTDQAALRKVLRRERRVELAWENLRYLDLMRWHQFENAFSHNMYGFTTSGSDQTAYYNAGNWFWPETPDFDEEGFPRFEKMVDGKYIVQHGERHFDPKVYLWPIPADDILIMKGKLQQNPGY